VSFNSKLAEYVRNARGRRRRPRAFLERFFSACEYIAMKKIIISLIVIVALVIFFVVSKNTKDNQAQNTDAQQFTSFCYYQETALENGLKDKAWLRLENSFQETGINTLRGEYQNLPAEKDKKIGNFAGEYILDETDPTFLKAMMLWQSQAEGMSVLEELAIVFNPEEVKIGFGEMKDRGDGIYIYGDKNAITYPQTLPAISCEELNERISVEKYVRGNIATISDTPPVLGGSWYVVSLDLQTGENTGSVVYEDGHIQESLRFSYEVSNETVSVTLLSSEESKENIEE